MRKTIIVVFTGVLLIFSTNIVFGSAENDSYFTKNVEDYAVNLLDNSPPDAPIIEGPTSCRVGIEYDWTFLSTDPDGDNITYYVDWGDECGGAEYHGPYPSGEEITLSHIYTTESTIIINAMAIDENGAESNFSYFEVTISRTRTINLILLERLPNAFPILRYIFTLIK